MKVILAEKSGACYGVQRALYLALEASLGDEPAYTLGSLIHNPGVVSDLAERGVDVVESVNEVREGVLIIRSHGVTPDVYEAAQESGLSVVDATCPHVTRAQKAAAEFAREGCHVIVVGEPGHPEVESLRAYALREGAVVDVVPSVDAVPAGLEAPIGVVVQTTQTPETMQGVIEAIRQQGVEPLVKKTICSATKLRQDAAAKLAAEVDVIVVIGGRNSSNTTRLAEICSAAQPRTHHIESVGEIDPSWFGGCETIGVTAGASTPENQIQDVVAYLESL